MRAHIHTWSVVERQIFSGCVVCCSHCNTLQHTRNTHTKYTYMKRSRRADPAHTATHCNTLQHTATHCNTLQHNTLQHTWSIVERQTQLTPQHTATHCNTLQHTWSVVEGQTQLTLQRTATHCSTLQHDTLQHTWSVVERQTQLHPHHPRQQSFAWIIVISTVCVCPVKNMSRSSRIKSHGSHTHVLQCVVVDVLQCVAVCCSRCIAVCCGRCVAVCCSVLQ